jgi:hypothetical protein
VPRDRRVLQLVFLRIGSYGQNIPSSRVLRFRVGFAVSIIFHDGTRRRSNVAGNSGFTSGGGTTTGPGVWPNPKKRATRRASASLEFTGKVS